MNTNLENIQDADKVLGTLDENFNTIITGLEAPKEDNDRFGESDFPKPKKGKHYKKSKWLKQRDKWEDERFNKAREKPLEQAPEDFWQKFEEEADTEGNIFVINNPKHVDVNILRAPSFIPTGFWNGHIYGGLKNDNARVYIEKQEIPLTPDQYVELKEYSNNIFSKFIKPNPKHKW